MKKTVKKIMTMVLAFALAVPAVNQPVVAAGKAHGICGFPHRHLSGKTVLARQRREIP